MSSDPQTSPKSQEAPNWASVCKEGPVDKEVELALSLALKRFHFSDDKEMELPSCYSGTERAFIHGVARAQGYLSKSRGRGSKRFLTIKKRDGSVKSKLVVPFLISRNSLDCVRMLLQTFPVAKERSFERIRASGRLNNSNPMIPQRRTPSKLDSFRHSLPVLEHQGEILQLIRDNRVVLVVGEAGCGKTTQIPQFLLDDCCRKAQPCRIFCTQPRSLSAVTVAERVAAERGERVGQTIGYHIRRESKVSLTTLLTFCTTEMFLRTLMTKNTSLAPFSHVIMDEVHERDGLTDLLLIKMRDLLGTIPTLKLVLTSAALDTELFIRYFGSCPLIYINRRHFEVKEFFLEDVLRLMDHGNVNKHKEKLRTQERKRKCLTELLEAFERKPEINKAVGNMLNQEEAPFKMLSPSGAEEQLHRTMGSCISDIFLYQDQQAFHQLYNLILSNSMDVDFLHSETGLTPLMVAASQGFLPQMEQLLLKGADMDVRASNGWTALDFAKHFQRTEAVNLLEASMPLQQLRRLDESCLLCESSELSPEDHVLLTLYHTNLEDERLNLDLIMDLLHNICSTTSEGAVLIFLPGYDEIVALRDLLLFEDKRFCSHSERYTVFTLHSDMQTIDQKEAMKASPVGTRKIILSTHIAETSITINDIVFVIDTGKVKQKSFDSLNQTSVSEMVWISKASALQRKGRAGRCRPGICFHLFSRLRFDKLPDLKVPQLLQIHLQELCLQTKLLAPASCSVAEFLSKAPQPPPEQAISQALHVLKTIGAMDENEDLTDLGFHLVDLPVVPQLAKMVLSAVVLKCLDPVLTIACTLAQRDPFVLPPQGPQRRAALHCRRSFSSNTLSDHMVLLQVFQAWQKACNDGCERSFCETNFLCQATLEMILSTRTQLLGQLRAVGFVRARGGSDIRDVNLNSNNWAVVKAALVVGMYPNLITVEQDTVLQDSGLPEKVHFHPTSVLSQFKEAQPAQSSLALPTEWFVYDEMRRRHRMISLRCCSVVTSVTVALFAGDQLHTMTETQSQKTTDWASSDSETEELAEMGIDDQVVFQMEREMGGLVSELRQTWQSLFIRRIRCPSKPWSQQDEAIIQTLVSVLEVEEQRVGLQQPSGIGRRPILVSAEGLRTPMRPSKNSLTSPSSDRFSERLPSDPHQEKEFRRDEASLREDPHCTGGSCCRSPQPLASSSEKVQQLLKVLSPGLGFPSPRYFIMKSNNFRNIDISQKKGIWSTTLNNETKLTKAFLDGGTVILIFSVQGSGNFQGYARMTSAISQESCQDWDLLGLGGVFTVDWIHKERLSFQLTQHLLNPWNNNNMVQISRDGQELEPEVASQLLSLWDSPIEPETTCLQNLHVLQPGTE